MLFLPKMILARRSLLIAAIICVSGPIAVAAAPSPAVKKACGAEMRSLCLRPWRFTPDAISICVEENRSKLSFACQEFWDAARKCQVEMKNVCGGLNPFTIKSCLANSADKFSESCRQTLGI